MGGAKGAALGCLPLGRAEAQGSALPHNLCTSTRDRADLGTMRRLNGCGVPVVAEDGDFCDGLAQGFCMVMSEPLPSRAAAEAQVEKARACGVTGQLRMVRRRIAPD